MGNPLAFLCSASSVPSAKPLENRFPDKNPKISKSDALSSTSYNDKVRTLVRFSIFHSAICHLHAKLNVLEP
jgi:hypothetical protein